MPRSAFKLGLNAALVVLGLGSLAAVWVTRELPGTGEASQQRGKLLPGLEQTQVTRLRLQRAGKELVLEANAGEFRITRPVAERADIASVRQLLGSLELASALREADVTPAQAGLDAGAFRCEIEQPPRKWALTVGGPAPTPSGARYAEVTTQGVSKRYVVSPGVASELEISLEKFREPRLLVYGRSELARIALNGERASLELEQEHGTFFSRVAGQRELAARRVVERLLAALSRLSSEELVEPEVAKRELGRPPLRVVLALVDQKLPDVTLTLGPSPTQKEQWLVVVEQAGKAARAGLIPREVGTALVPEPDEARLLAPFAARTDEIEELRVVRGAQKLVLARKDKAFVLQAPRAGEVPLDAGNARIAAWVDARGERAAAPDLAKLGLAPAAGEASIQISGADEATHREERVALGTVLADGRQCVQRLLDRVVLCFSASAATAFDADASLLRSLGVLHFAPSQLVRVSITARGLKQSLERHADGSYELTEPAGFAHDGALVADLVQTLGTLQATRWVASQAEPRFGLGEPQLVVNLTLASGEAPTLLLGAAAEDGYFAQLSTDSAVFVLARSLLTDLSTPLVERSLLPNGADVAAAELLGGDGKTKLHGSAATPELRETLASLRAERAVHLGPALASEGLAKPRLTLHFGAVSVAIGDCAELSGSSVCYARRSDVAATFALSRRIVSDLEDALHAR